MTTTYNVAESAVFLYFHVFFFVLIYYYYNFVDDIKEIPLYYENFDLRNIHTPIKIKEFAHHLRVAGYPEGKVSFLEEGSTNGFDIGYEGP